MQNQELLQKYFSNTLTDEDEKLFQNLIENDLDFKAQFTFEKNLKQAITSYQTDLLKEELKGLESRINTEAPKKLKTNNFKFPSIAIAASLLLLLGWFGYNSLVKTNHNTLFANNFEAYPNTVYTITRGDTVNTLEREAFVAYESKDYKTAIEKMDAIAPENTKDYIRFYKAQSYLNLDDSVNAKTLFTQVVLDNTSFVAESTWYLALVALKDGKETEAKKHLEDLIANYSYKNEVAKSLLEALN
ncbi:MAG: tetratricopeptide repeat protein [Oceanihabitans sp.]